MAATSACIFIGDLKEISHKYKLCNEMILNQKLCNTIGNSIMIILESEIPGSSDGDLEA